MMWGRMIDNPQLNAMLTASATDPTPTLAQFRDDVANHRVAYYIAVDTKGHGSDGGGHARADIARWVAATFVPQKVGDATVYDLAKPKSAHQAAQ